LIIVLFKEALINSLEADLR